MAIDNDGNIIPQAVAEESATSTDEIQDLPEAVTEESATSQEGEVSTEEGAEEGQHRSKAVDELITQRRKRQDAERRAQELEVENIRLKQGMVQTQQQQQPQQHQPQVGGRPQPEHFQTWEDYQRAEISWQVQQGVQQAMRQSSFEQRIQIAAQHNPEILDAFRDPNLVINPAMAECIRESEVAPDIILYLRNNPTESFRISQMTPINAVRMMGQIEARIQVKQATQPKKFSDAPAPIKTVGGKGSPSIDEDKESIDAFMERERAKRR
jgi:hypothetical protein